MACIISYVRNMQKIQQDVVRNYLAGRTNSKRKGWKEQKLFDQIIVAESKSATDRSVAASLGMKHNSARYKVLKARLIERVMEALCSENHFGANIFRSDDKNTLKIRKKIFQCYVVSKIPNNEKAPVLERLLNETIKLCIKYETYDVLIEALMMKRNEIFFNQDFRDLMRLMLDIQYYTQCSAALSKASECYFAFTRMSNSYGLSAMPQVTAFLKTCLDELAPLEVSLDSKRFFYLYRVLKMNYDESRGALADALDNCIEINAIVTADPHLFSADIAGRNFMVLCRYNILIKNFSEAMDYALCAQREFKGNILEYQAAKEYQFYACYYGGNFEQAQEISLSLYEFAKKKNLQSARYTFFMGCSLFQLGKYADAYKCISTVNNMGYGQPDWNLGLKYLTIMLHVELGDVYAASAAITALRKYFERSPENAKPTEKDKLVLRCLWTLDKYSFAPPDDSIELKQPLLDLEKYETEQNIHLFSHELLSISRWIIERDKQPIKLMEITKP